MYFESLINAQLRVEHVHLLLNNRIAEPFD